MFAVQSRAVRKSNYSPVMSLFADTANGPLWSPIEFPGTLQLKANSIAMIGSCLDSVLLWHTDFDKHNASNKTQISPKI